MNGGCSRIRTYDPLIKSQLLYQLSYAPARPEKPPARARNIIEIPSNASDVRAVIFEAARGLCKSPSAEWFTANSPPRPYNLRP